MNIPKLNGNPWFWVLGAAGSVILALVATTLWMAQMRGDITRNMDDIRAITSEISGGLREGAIRQSDLQQQLSELAQISARVEVGLANVDQRTSRMEDRWESGYYFDRTRQMQELPPSRR